MKGARLMKALAKKKKWNMNKCKTEDDENLSSDDEEDISKNMIGKWYRDNAYIIVKYLGKGTFSRVWMVYHLEKKEFYAMKIIYEKYHEDSAYEFKINQLIRNDTEHLLKIYDMFYEGKSLHIITELMGASLLSVFNKGYDYETHFPSIDFVKFVTRQILSNIQELHNRDIVHTDLKQENIMINIMEDNLINYMDNLGDLDNKYNDILQSYYPTDLYEMTTDKRKKTKRKCKIRSRKQLSQYIADYYNTFVSYQENKEEDEIIPQENKYEKIFMETPEKIKLKIIDFGNAEINEKCSQDIIQIRYYRPPENIINGEYSVKSDIWSIGCLVYEFLTGNYLFDVNGDDTRVSDREHLHEMYEILGKMPREMADECEFSEELFDIKGRILKMKQCDYTSLSEILIKEFNFSEKDSIEIEEFLKILLDYCPKKRGSACDLLEHTWLIKNK